MPPHVPSTVPGSLGSPPPAVPPSRPRMFNGATVHGFRGIRTLRHPAEIPLLVATSMATALAYLSWIALVIWLVAVPEPTGLGAQVRDFFLSQEGSGAQFLLLVPLIPIILWVARAMLYAKLRATAVQMSPTQFPEGYRMVVEAAQQFGLRRVPDAYVIMGNGQINAFAAGHGYRRFVVVHSDMFEIGGRTRDPEALRFVIGHEVGHLAAGHISMLRLLFVTLGLNVPLLGKALVRAQEYTADNHGYSYAPAGVPGVVGVLSGGKYLGAEVNTHALADRATREKGLWLHMSVWRSTHPSGPHLARQRPARPQPPGTDHDPSAGVHGMVPATGSQRQRAVRFVADTGADARGAGLHLLGRAQRGAIRSLPRCGLRGPS